jgi:cytochrome c551/c552
VFTRLKRLGLPVLLVLALLILFGGFFLVEFLSYSPSDSDTGSVSADSYSQEVAALLEETDSEHGQALFTTYGCAACHESAASTGVAPSLSGIAERAGERRPPLPSAAYIYESIVHPSAFIVNDYSNVMPQNFRERMSDEELGDIIAYLLTR